MKRILVYSHDTYGLGNIRRMVALVEHLAQAHPDASLLILSGSPMMQAFRLSPGIDYIKLPCLHRDEQGVYGSRFLDLPDDTLVRLRSDLILNTVLNFDPDLILVDKKPLGVNDELAPTLELLRRRSIRPRMALVLREILDAPQTTRTVWDRNDYQQVIEEFYDSVLVLGPQCVFDTAAEYGFNPVVSAMVRYCGYVRKTPRLRPVEQVRQELGAQGRKLVLLTVGGGKDGFPVLRAALEALAPRIDSHGLHLQVVAGPEMDGDAVAMLARYKDQHISTTEFTNDLLSYMQAADLVISMAGYNTVTELLALDKRSLLVPRTVPSLEQLIRADRLSQLGLCSVVYPDELSALQLFDSIEKALHGYRPSTSSVGVSMDGLHSVAQEVGDLLVSRFTDTFNCKAGTRLLRMPAVDLVRCPIELAGAEFQPGRLQRAAGSLQ